VLACCVLATVVPGEAAAPDAIAALSEAADALAFAQPLGVPGVDVVSVIQRSGLTSSVINATLSAAAVTNAPTALGRGFQLGLRRVRRGPTVVQQSTGDGWGFPMAVTALPVEAIGSIMGRDVSGPVAAGQLVMSATSAALRGALAGDRVELITPGGWIATYTIGLVAPDAQVVAPSS